MFSRFGRRPQGQSPARRMLSRAMPRVAVALALATTFHVVSASAASATIYNGGGSFGPYVTNTASCDSRLFGNERAVSVSALPPRVFALDAAAGAGNDSAWVHYAAFLKNETTGAFVVQPTMWSSWALATDVVPATWSYADTFQVASNAADYRIYYVIEWWTSTERTAWIADRLESYRLTDQATIGRGSASTCAYLMRLYG